MVDGKEEGEMGTERLIDPSEIIRGLTAMKSAYDAIALDGMIKALKEATTVDAVEVVRCKDCALCKLDNTVYTKDVFGNENDTHQYHCLMGYGYNKADHFCSFGERKTDNG